ncbi:hypothetical protein MRX96_029046 [Rhipicephalus microplus]
MIEFAMQQTSHLVEIELSCLVDSNTVEVEMNNIILSAHRQGHCTLNLRRIYCKVGPQHNIEILSALLHISPKADNLRVHLVCGDFKKTVQQCRVLLDLHKQLDKFTFTSEVLSPMQVEPVLLFDFAAYAAICANVTLRRFAVTRCLYLLTETPLSLGAASDAVTKASRSRLKLKCVHAHYPSIVDPSIKETITRLRGPGRGKEYRLFRGSPCFHVHRQLRSSDSSSR